MTHTTQPVAASSKVERVAAIIKPAIAQNRFCKIVFVKKDGTDREILLGRSKNLEATVAAEPSDATLKRKATLKDNGMLCVEELTPDRKFQFRTVNLATVKSVTVNGLTTTF